MFILISMGAIPAAILRWKVDEIFIVNLVGCFLLGCINASLISRKYKLIFGLGFCGSLTSFSGWSFQLFELLSQGLFKLFVLNLITFLLFGCFSCGLGYFLAKKIHA